MSILSLFGLGLFAAADKMRVSTNRRKCQEEWFERGGDRDFNIEKNSMFRQDVYRDWNNEKKLFPAEYIEYFVRNNRALDKYVTSMVCKMEHEAGFRPFHSLGYDQRNYDPFRGFNQCYAEKIKIFNDTGVFYV